MNLHIIFSFVAQCQGLWQGKRCCSSQVCGAGIMTREPAELCVQIALKKGTVLQSSEPNSDHLSRWSPFASAALLGGLSYFGVFALHKKMSSQISWKGPSINTPIGTLLWLFNLTILIENKNCFFTKTNFSSNNFARTVWEWSEWEEENWKLALLAEVWNSI
jgi:hypothetical protein